MLFGLVVAAHLPLALQTTLSGGSIESIFVEIAHGFTAGIILFSPTSKGTYVQHSFKYFSDIDPITCDIPSNICQVLTLLLLRTSSLMNFPPPSNPAEPTSDHLDSLDHILDPTKDFQYTSMPLSCALANTKFGYLHIGKKFIENLQNYLSKFSI